MSSLNVMKAREAVIRATLRVLSSERPERESDPHNDAEVEYADDELALAARDLYLAVEADDDERKPVGWRQ